VRDFVHEYLKAVDVELHRALVRRRLVLRGACGDRPAASLGLASIPVLARSLTSAEVAVVRVPRDSGVVNSTLCGRKPASHAVQFTQNTTECLIDRAKRLRGITAARRPTAATP
jgi:hypothetical protein